LVGEIIKRYNNVDQAMDCRDATAKVNHQMFYLGVLLHIIVFHNVFWLFSILSSETPLWNIF